MEDKPSPSVVEKNDVKTIEIDGKDPIHSVAFLAGGKHIISGDIEGKIRRWAVEDGKEVGTQMDAGSPVRCTAVSQDGKWIVSGTEDGQVTVWDAESYKKVNEFEAHSGNPVYAVDVSPDGMEIATGSNDNTACIWSRSTARRLLGPFQHKWFAVAVKFSPNGRLLATATWYHHSVRVYDSEVSSSPNSRLLIDLPISICGPSGNQSLAWESDSNHLFVLSYDSEIYSINVSAGQTLFKWLIRCHDDPTSIHLANNGAFIAASDDSSVTFWDTTTHEQIGPPIHHLGRVYSMAISANYDLVAGGDTKIALWNLHHILPSPYIDNVSVLASRP